MQVYHDQPFQIVYSLFEHEYLGYLFEPFVIQLNAKDELTLQHQSISSKNAREFAARLDAADFKMIAVIDTNVLISAVIVKQSVSDLTVRKAFLNDIVICSAQTTLELSETLKKEKFDKFFKTKYERDLFIHLFA